MPQIDHQRLWKFGLAMRRPEHLLPAEPIHKRPARLQVGNFVLYKGRIWQVLSFMPNNRLWLTRLRFGVIRVYTAARHAEVSCLGSN